MDAIIPEGGKTTNLKKVEHFFRRTGGSNENYGFFREVLGQLQVHTLRAPMARAKILGYFVGVQDMTSYFSNDRIFA